MINITVSDKKIADQKVLAYAFALEQGDLPASLLSFAKTLCPMALPTLLKESKFAGKKLECTVFPFLVNEKLAHLILVGLGKREKAIDIEIYRRAIATIIRKAQHHKISLFALELPASRICGVDADYLAEQTAIICELTNYHFNEYITQESRKETEVVEVVLCVDAKAKKESQEGVKKGQIISQAVNKTRHWIDLPPSDLTPPELADRAIAIAKKTGLKITVFSEKEVIKMGMGGLAGISRGSDLDCRLLIMEYKAKAKNAPTIAFVGKGITFDSGGLSLKPAQSMEDMKQDMSGAAAVVATMEALAQLKPDVNVIGVAPLAENLPSGKAVKPGDIVRFYNGKTAEVKNTDAEGRLILADALSYTVKHYKPDAIIDLATLTGACEVALGKFFCGMLSEHDDLVVRVQEASSKSGDRVWRLPLNDDYKPAIVSTVADLANIGSARYKAGTITAAHFLQNFVDDVPWVHLDIAGVAFDVPDMPYFRPGATGFGVRLLVELAMEWKK
jgi:leucyl aminopeptidase